MTEKYIGCGCIPSGDSFCTWEPVFQDSKPSEIHIEVCDQMDINLGSDVKPVIGTAPDYELADNKPSINGVTLIGDKTNEDIHIGSLSNMDIENILNSFI